MSLEADGKVREGVKVLRKLNGGFESKLKSVTKKKNIAYLPLQRLPSFFLLEYLSFDPDNSRPMSYTITRDTTDPSTSKQFHMDRIN